MEVIFLFASAASSSAYLTASEIFPLETRALAITIFYAAGTAIGGLAAAVMELRFGIDRCRRPCSRTNRRSAVWLSRFYGASGASVTAGNPQPSHQTLH